MNEFLQDAQTEKYRSLYKDHDNSDQELRFLLILVRGIMLVNGFPIESVPAEFKEQLNRFPEPTGWRLEVLKLLGNSVFGKMNFEDLKLRSECYRWGHTTGLAIYGFIHLLWSGLKRRDEIVLEKTKHPAFNLPKISKSKINKFTRGFFKACKQKYFSTKADALSNVRDFLRGLPDGFCALNIGDEGIIFENVSQRIYVMLLMFDNAVENLDTVEEIHGFIKAGIEPKSLMPELDSFKKLCQRIGLRGKKYESMDRAKLACPLKEF